MDGKEKSEIWLSYRPSLNASRKSTRLEGKYSTNFEIKFALLLSRADAQSSNGSVLRELLIVSLSMSILNFLSSEIAKSIRINTLLL